VSRRSRVVAEKNWQVIIWTPGGLMIFAYALYNTVRGYHIPHVDQCRV
jgi:hypothetical protein